MELRTSGRAGEERVSAWDGDMHELSGTQLPQIRWGKIKMNNRTKGAARAVVIVTQFESRNLATIFALPCR